MLTPKELLSRFGGIARGTYLQQYGCTRDHLASAVQAGEIRRVRPGVWLGRAGRRHPHAGCA